MDFQRPNQEEPLDRELPVQNTQPDNQNASADSQQPVQEPQPQASAQQQQLYGYNNQASAQQQQPYGYNNQTSAQQQPYGYNNQPQGNMPYGNPYQNNNGYPYYNRSNYQLPPKEPGSSLANAAMVLGIIAIISCFTFTVYPPFILGSIAIVLALLSKGRRPKLFPKAKTGIICAAIGLVVNTFLVTSVMYMLFTDPDIRSEVNRTFKKQYGITFDEALDEIMEENGLYD